MHIHANTHTLTLAPGMLWKPEVGHSAPSCGSWELPCPPPRPRSRGCLHSSPPGTVACGLSWVPQGREGGVAEELGVGREDTEWEEGPARHR